MRSRYFKHFISFLVLILLSLFSTIFVKAQTTEFTYQGKLTDSSMPANTNYDFEFRLFSVNAGGSAINIIQRPGVQVSNGIFTVKLDFGNAFTGEDRYLEIAVKPSGGGAFTTLAPRSQITSAPYTIRSLSAANSDTATTANNSLQLGGVSANQFILTGDSRLSNDRNPLPGSTNYVQNRTTQQTSTSFNISGTGTANIFNSAAQFNISGNRVLALGAGLSLFVGQGSGAAITTGIENTFVGTLAGNDTTTGSSNSFFGRNAGANNTTGSNNAFFGNGAGLDNTTADNNSFFGTQAGNNNTTAASGAFFGYQSGLNNTTGGNNSFFGFQSGRSNTTGTNNSFLGYQAGLNNVTGSNSSFFGTKAGLVSTGDNNSFFGYEAGLDNTSGTRNSLFGYRTGNNNTTGESNSFFGTVAGGSNTTGIRNAFVGDGAGFGTTTGGGNVFMGFNAGDANTTGNNNTAIGLGANVGAGNLLFATAIGSDAVVSTSNTIALGRSDGSDTVDVPGRLQVDTLGTAGSTNLCLNGSNRIASCSSSLRYKTQIQTFSGGLNIVNRLRPITFNWIDGGKSDVGFGAEEVNAIEPLLTTRNAQGEIEGVKYGQITTVLVNAVNEQQSQIEKQQKQIEEQKNLLVQAQQQIEALKKLVCSQNPEADICKEGKK